MGGFFGSGGTDLTAPTLASGVTLATADDTQTFRITNADAANPAAVDLAFASSSIQATAFDQGTAQSPSYVLEAGTFRDVTFVRDYGANDYGDGDVGETVTARIADGSLISQSMTTEPFIDIANAAQPDGFCVFNGTSDFLTTPYNAAFDFALTDPFSIAFWIKSAATSYIISNNEDTNKEGFMVLGVVPGATPNHGTALLYLWSDSSNWASIRSTLKIMTGSWVHYCCTYDGTWATNSYASMKQYIDGVLDTPLATGALGTVTQLNSSNPLCIGSFTGYTGASAYMDGSIDDVGIWDVALDAADIVALAAKTRCHKVQRANLVCYYDFDYVSGSLTNGIEDRSANGLDMAKG